jgi:hypothetical protein
MIKIYRTAALLMLAIAIISGPAMAQAYSGAGTWTSTGGTSGQYVGGGVSTGTGGTQTFSLGSGYMYSMVSVNPNDVKSLEDQGVRTITVPAGSTVYITAQTGQPLNINTAPGQAPNMLVFGPNGFVGAGVFGGQGTGAYAGAGGAGAGAGASAGGTGAGAVAGPGGTMQMYSFTGSTGQAFLITQQTGGNMDRVLVVFQ